MYSWIYFLLYKNKRSRLLGIHACIIVVADGGDFTAAAANKPVVCVGCSLVCKVSGIFVTSTRHDTDFLRNKHM